jgi:uncharacterized membrane protein YgcG
MNMLCLFLFNPIVERLGWGLLHFLWEGAVIAVLLAVVLRVLRYRSPSSRYLAGWVALGGDGLRGASDRVARDGRSRPGGDSRRGGNGRKRAAGGRLDKAGAD